LFVVNQLSRALIKRKIAAEPANYIVGSELDARTAAAINTLARTLDSTGKMEAKAL
jgi:hypothetical protein